jgi:predicted nucleotidyltransferase
MRGPEEIQSDLAECKSQLQAAYPIRALGVFGSYARGEQDPESDLDVLVEFGGPVTLFDLVRLENELTRQLGVDVDLVTRDSLKPRIETRVSDDVVYV